MERVMMRVDVVSTSKMFGAGLLFLVVLLVTLVTSAFYPSSIEEQQYSAYDCPNFSHTWENGYCSGKRLANGDWWSTLFGMGPLNRFFLIEVTPYSFPNNSNGDNWNEIPFKVQLSGRNDEMWTDITHKISIPSGDNTFQEDIVKELVRCPGIEQGDPLCSSFTLIYEEFIEYEEYRLGVALDFSQTDLDPRWVSDVVFTLWYGHPGFATLSVAYRVVFMLLGLIVLGWFTLRLRKIPAGSWNWEQKATAGLIFAVLGFDDPFYVFRFALSGWFFPFASSTLVTLFSAGLLLYWLMQADKLRLMDTDPREKVLRLSDPRQILKLIAIAVYCIAKVAYLAWASILDEMDPVYGLTTGSIGVTAFQYISSALWAFGILWVGMIVIFSISAIANGGETLLTRFLFFIAPACVVIFSTLMGLLSATFGPMGETAVSFVYFITLNNLYVWSLVWGYWPVEKQFSVPNPIVRYDGETTPLTRPNL